MGLRNWVGSGAVRSLAPRGLPHRGRCRVAGNTVWSLHFSSADPGLRNAEFGAFNIFHFERFRLRPWVSAVSHAPPAAGAPGFLLVVTTTDSLRRRYKARGRLAVYKSGMRPWSRSRSQSWSWGTCTGGHPNAGEWQ